jgi:peptidyl-prolyl cis-trans isomerase D
MASDQLSQPVKGNNGVYVIVQSNISDPTETDVASQKSRMTSLRESQANYEAFEALREAANIEDNRAKFF